MLAAIFGPLARWAVAQPSAAPSAATAVGGAASLSGASFDATALASLLAPMAGGVVDARGAKAAKHDALDTAVRERARLGQRIWVALLPPEVELAGALQALGGRINPGEDEMVLVASAQGVRALVPGLKGAPSRIDAAFQASVRALAADLDTGLVEYVRRLEEERTSERRAQRMILWGLAGLGLMVALVLFARWGRFRVDERAWAREAAAAHAARVAACQEKLHAIATAGGADYDRWYAELKRLQACPPADAAVGLDELRRQIDGGAR